MATPIKPSDLFLIIPEVSQSFIDGLIEYFNEMLRARDHTLSVSYKVLLSERPGRTRYHIRYVVQLFKEQGWQINEVPHQGNDTLIIFELPERN